MPLNSGGDRKLHGRGIDRLGALGAEIIVDRSRDALGGGEIGVAQRQPHIGQAVERELDLALDDGAVGDAADRRHAADDLGGFAFGLETVDRDRTLRHRVDVAVGAEQGGDEQGAAPQVLGIAERGHRDIHPGALGAERGQVAGHHDGGDVAGPDGGAADVDAHALEHRLQRLLGEGDVVQGVAGAVEADDEAVADQLVLPDALDIGEVLDPGRRGRGRAGTLASASTTAQATRNSFAETTLGILCSPLRSFGRTARHSHDGGSAINYASPVPLLRFGLIY